MSHYEGFYDQHKSVPWKPMMTSRGVPGSVMPVIVPCEESKADGYIFYQALKPPRIARLPVRQLNPRELLKAGSALWNEHLSQTKKLVSALEANKGVSKVIHELLADGEASQLERRHDQELYTEALENPWAYAACLLNSGLSSANAPLRLSVWWRNKGKRLDVGLYCPDPRTAAYALLLKRGRNITTIAVCPRCTTEFEQNEWHPTKYCTPRCRNAASQANFRRKKAKNELSS